MADNNSTLNRKRDIVEKKVKILSVKVEGGGATLEREVRGCETC